MCWCCKFWGRGLWLEGGDDFWEGISVNHVLNDWVEGTIAGIVEVSERTDILLGMESLALVDGVYSFADVKRITQDRYGIASLLKRNFMLQTP